MTRRRIGFWLVLTLIAVLLAAGLWVRHAWHDLLQANGIEQLDWQGLDLSFSSLLVDAFTVHQTQRSRQIQAQGQGLKLDWEWRGLDLQVTALELRQLRLDVHTQPEPEVDSTGIAESIPDIPPEPPTWLPRTLNIERFHVTLPCATGRCPLQGTLDAARNSDLLPAQITLVLHHDDHDVEADIHMDGGETNALDLTGTLAIDGERALAAQTEYRTDDGHGLTRWTGTVELPRIPRTDWLLSWLKAWQSLPVDTLPDGPETGELKTEWQLQWPTDAAPLQQVTGSASVHGRLPQPWPLPGVGTLQGSISAELQAQQGTWRAQTAQADLQLTQPASWISTLPEPLRAKRIALRIQPANPLPGTARPLLPLKVTVQTQGNADLNIDSHLAVATEAPWAAKLGHTRIQGSLPRYEIAGWRLEKPELDITVSGQADAKALALKLAKGSSLRVSQVNGGESEAPLSITGFQANLANLPLEARYDLQQARLGTLSLRGPVTLSAQRLQQPQLKPQGWTFDGDLAANLQRLTLEGRLGSRAGANADIALRYPFQGALSLDAEAQIDGKQGGENWAATLSQWPATLSIDRGGIEAVANLTVPHSGAWTLESTLDADALSVTYNRMALTELDGDVVFDLTPNQLEARTIELRLSEVNPGLPIGPITVAGRYRAQFDRPATGTLTLDAAKAELLGGRVRVAPQRWELAETPLRIPLQVSNLQLSRLMALYPAENLSGTGILNGEVPVWIAPDGVHVEKGRISAQAPGGRLQLPGDRLAGFAQGNAAMQIVAEAVKNFHYSVLDSTIDYAKDGTLNLGLHIEGNNPNVRDGQPVVLNINLEEDIPALLTSLQLSGRVNEAVTQRVKKLVEKQQSGDMPDLEIERGIE
ncbi:intermembrane phospholipid transport protein YdbH family protein [Marinobacter fonticola]|uniref:intermembrane phospholipid transport protein YdbH family protein n=1 Tax=Marinobacter fonticola TaxID=2603215 RepID=UPI0011E86558|nr:YdbH domain-containing protein [Marinobacter fonticola]